MTILVTTYNHEPFIAQALHSVLAQQVDFEYDIIIGDDCSTDGTRKIVRAFQAANPDTVRLVLPDGNLGRGGIPLWLRCLEQARGDYLALLDGDDYWTAPDKLQEQARVLDEDPHLLAVLHNARVTLGGEAWNLYEDGRPSRWSLDRILEEASIQNSTMVLRRLRPDGSPHPWLQSLDPEALSDWDVALLAARHGRVGYIDRVMSVYRQHDAGAWSGLHRAERLSGIIARYERVKAELGVAFEAAVEEVISTLCYEAAREYEALGRYGEAGEYLRRCLLGRPKALETYAPGIGALGPAIWASLDARCRQYEHPLIFRASRLLEALGHWAGMRMREAQFMTVRLSSLATGRSAGVLAAGPVVVTNRFGAAGLGTAALAWHAVNTPEVEIRIGAPKGPLFWRAPGRGLKATGPWVHDRMIFCLLDVSHDPPRSLDAITVRVRRDSKVVAAETAEPRPPGAITLDALWLYRGAAWVGTAREWLQARAARLTQGLRRAAQHSSKWIARFRRPGEVRALLSAARFHLRRALRYLRAPLPIRIVFLAQDLQDWWSLEPVYRACAADTRFAPIIVNSGWHSPTQVADCSRYFQRQGIPYVDGLHARLPLETLRPDLIAVSSPYDQFRGAEYTTDDLVRCAKVIYIPYCIDYADRKGEATQNTYGLETHTRAWRIFSRSPRTIASYGKHGGIPPRRIVCLGHPRIERYFSDSSRQLVPPDLEQAARGKFKIIYAPHHTVHGWSTFLSYAASLRTFVREHEDVFLVFRPHPLLMGRLTESGAITADDFRDFFSGDRCRLYDEAEYYALFQWSDLLLSDASSFLVEYAPTRKPIVYLHREDGRGGLDESLEEDVFASCYVGLGSGDIERLLRQLKSGWDPLRGQREWRQEQMSVGIFAVGAGRRIADYLAREMGCRRNGAERPKS